MGIQTDIVIADFAEARDVADSSSPAADWEGITFNGFHHVQLCTLLSLLKTGDADAKVDVYFDLIKAVSAPDGEGPVVYAVMPAQVSEVAKVSSLEDEELESLATRWGATEEFSGWSAGDVRDLLRELGDLAETASLTGKCLMIWQSL